MLFRSPDLFRLSSQTVGRRLAFIIASALIGMVAMATAFLVSERRLILDERANAVRQTVELAHGIVAHFHAEARSGASSQRSVGASLRGGPAIDRPSTTAACRPTAANITLIIGPVWPFSGTHVRAVRCIAHRTKPSDSQPTVCHLGHTSLDALDQFATDKACGFYGLE